MKDTNGSVPYRRPELPVEDEFGQNCIEYHCWTCKRPGYMAREAAEMLHQHGQRFICLPCGKPWLWKWTKDEETGREILGNLTSADQRRLLRSTPGGEERAEYTGALSTLQTLRDQRDLLKRRIVEDNESLESLARSIPVHEKLVVELNQRVQAATTNAVQGKRDEIANLQAKIAELKDQLTKG